MRIAIELRRLHAGLGILLFSQYIETRYAAELLADDATGIGYLLKDRVADVADFVEALERAAAGGTALDPEVVTQLMGISRRSASISVLTPLVLLVGLFNGRRRLLHDIVLGTVVINSSVRSQVAQPARTF